MRKKVIRCIEAKVLRHLKERRDYYLNPRHAGSSYVYYGFAYCADDSDEHIQALKSVVENECRKIGWDSPTTLAMTVCKIKPQQSKSHAHMTMVKVLVPNREIVGYFSKKHIEL